LGTALSDATRPARRPVILAIFVLSGAAALIDEIVWSRQLVLVFGNTTQAVSAILTGFFGGVALGSFFGGRIADRVRSPLRMYGLLELALAVVVVVTPISFRFIDDLYRGIYPTLEGSPQVLALVRVMLAVLALAPATVMMGATLPTLTRYLARGGTLAGAFSRLYAANTVGAILGTVLAGFVLIELLGLSGALAVGAGCSAAAGLAALWLSRAPSMPAPDAAPETTARPTPPSETTTPRPAGATAGHPAPRLALTVAFISGLTSLGYQVAWTRLLASGTGNTTYVFTTILATFLVGIAIGAVLFAALRSRLGDPLRLLAASQVLAAALALAGLVLVLVAPHTPTPGKPFETLGALIGSALLVVLPVTIVLGVAFPASSALLEDDTAHAGAGSGGLLAVNTVGAILGSLVVPFVLIPLLGSPVLVAVLAATNATLGIVLGWRLVAGRAGRAIAAIGVVVAAVIVVTAVRPGVLIQPTEAYVASAGGQIFESTEDEIASVQAGQISFTPELWVAGTSMTLLTVDAKLMPVLPLIARPASTHALVVAFGMGSAFRGALIAGLTAEAIELVPSVPKMFGHYYSDAAAVLANPRGRVIVTDGRNHLELTDRRYDIILTDPPPPIESSGAAVISSKEYYEAGQAHLTDGGIMMQWLPYGGLAADFNDHIRTFASVFPEVTLVKGAGGYGIYMLGSSRPIAFDPANIREVLGRPGVLADISSAYDSPATTIDDWMAVVARQTWQTGGEAVRQAVGSGPLITDDRPRTEYFLLRRLFGDWLP
jgi:spermidine synthase